MCGEKYNQVKEKKREKKENSKQNLEKINEGEYSWEVIRFNLFMRTLFAHYIYYSPRASRGKVHALSLSLLQCARISLYSIYLRLPLIAHINYRREVCVCVCASAYTQYVIDVGTL